MLNQSEKTAEQDSPENRPSSQGLFKAVIAGGLNAAVLTPADLRIICGQLGHAMTWREAFRLPAKYYHISAASNLTSGFAFFYGVGVAQSYTDRWFGPTLMSQAAAATFGGMLQSLASTPFSTVRAIMTHHYKTAHRELSVTETWHSLPTAHAARVRKLYSGLTPSLIRSGFWPIYFSLDLLTRTEYSRRLGRPLSEIESFSISILTGMLTTPVTYPLATLSTLSKVEAMDKIGPLRKLACAVAENGAKAAISTLYRGPFMLAAVRMGAAAVCTKTAQAITKTPAGSAGDETTVLNPFEHPCPFAGI